MPTFRRVGLLSFAHQVSRHNSLLHCPTFQVNYARVSLGLQTRCEHSFAPEGSVEAIIFPCTVVVPRPRLQDTLDVDRNFPHNSATTRPSALRSSRTFVTSERTLQRDIMPTCLAGVLHPQPPYMQSAAHCSTCRDLPTR